MSGDHVELLIFLQFYFILFNMALKTKYYICSYVHLTETSHAGTSMAAGRNGAHYIFLLDRIVLYNVHDSIPFSKMIDDIEYLLNSLI